MRGNQGFRPVGMDGLKPRDCLGNSAKDQAYPEAPLGIAHGHEPLCSEWGEVGKKKPEGESSAPDKLTTSKAMIEVIRGVALAGLGQQIIRGC